MGTRPDTIAAALFDSPAGLAAWIIDKLRDWSDCGSDLERPSTATPLHLAHAVPDDRTASVPSFHQYLYYPHNSPAPHRSPCRSRSRRACEPPFELFPRSIAERAASDIRHYSDARPRRPLPRVRGAAAHRRRARRVHALGRIARPGSVVRSSGTRRRPRAPAPRAARRDDERTLQVGSARARMSRSSRAGGTRTPVAGTSSPRARAASTSVRPAADAERAQVKTCSPSAVRGPSSARRPRSRRRRGRSASRRRRAGSRRRTRRDPTRR